MDNKEKASIGLHMFYTQFMARKYYHIINSGDSLSLIPKSIYKHNIIDLNNTNKSKKKIPPMSKAWCHHSQLRKQH